MNKRVLVTGGISLAILAVVLYFRKRIARKINATMGNYFTIEELYASSKARANNIDNTPSATVVANLTKMRDNLLNPIREEYGMPIVVSSGYRCEKLNALVGGRSDSQHRTGNAADLVPASGGSLAGIFRAAVKVGGYDQLIIEKANGSKWIHVSYRTNGEKQRGQMMAYEGGVYTNIDKSNYNKYLA